MRSQKHENEDKQEKNKKNDRNENQKIRKREIKSNRRKYSNSENNLKGE